MDIMDIAVFIFFGIFLIDLIVMFMMGQRLSELNTKKGKKYQNLTSLIFGNIRMFALWRTLILNDYPNDKKFTRLVWVYRLFTWPLLLFVVILILDLFL